MASKSLSGVVEDIISLPYEIVERVSHIHCASPRSVGLVVGAVVVFAGIGAIVDLCLEINDIGGDSLACLAFFLLQFLAVESASFAVEHFLAVDHLHGNE